MDAQPPQEPEMATTTREQAADYVARMRALLKEGHELADNLPGDKASVTRPFHAAHAKLDEANTALSGLFGEAQPLDGGTNKTPPKP
jgi:hypothetical protein